DRNRALFDAECRAGGGERRARRVPQSRQRIVWIRFDGGNSACEDQPPTARRVRLAFVRMAAMHHRGHAVETWRKEMLIRVDLERVRHVAVAIGKHPIEGNDGETLDAE